MAHRSKSKRGESSRKLLKQFSTLSEGSLHSPSLTLCLELVSKLYHRHILLRDGCPQSRRNMEWEEKFDIDNFITTEYDTVMQYSLCHIGGPMVFHQQKRRSKVAVPRVSTINTFLVSIFKKLHLNVESSIVSLIYTERLLEKRNVCLTPRNWRSVVVVSMLTASKVWDDLSSWNIEFANLLPILSVAAINRLEGVYLNALQYDLYISSSEYAKYYFALRGLKNTKTEHIPRHYLNTKIARKRRSKSRSKEMELDQSLSRKTRHFEQKSILNFAANLQVDSPSSARREESLVEEAKYPDTQSERRKDSMLSIQSMQSVQDQSQLTSSSDSSSNSSKLNTLHPVIREDEEMKDGQSMDDLQQRTQAMVLTPNKIDKTASRRIASSMPSKIQTLRPLLNE